MNGFSFQQVVGIWSLIVHCETFYIYNKYVKNYGTLNPFQIPAVIEYDSNDKSLIYRH